MLWSKGRWGLAQTSSYHLSVASGPGWPKVLECVIGVWPEPIQAFLWCLLSQEQEGCGKGLWELCPLDALFLPGYFDLRIS